MANEDQNLEAYCPGAVCGIFAAVRHNPGADAPENRADSK